MLVGTAHGKINTTILNVATCISHEHAIFYVCEYLKSIFTLIRKKIIIQTVKMFAYKSIPGKEKQHYKSSKWLIV